MIKDTALQIILTVILSSVFIIVFYFSYGKDIEGKIVVNECTEVAKGYTDVYQAVAGSTPAPQCSLIPLPSPIASDQDNQVAATNAKYLKYTEIALGVGVGLAIILAIAIYFIGSRPTISIKVLVWRSFLNLIAVALIEFLFLQFIIANNIELDSSNVNSDVFSALIA